MYENSYYSLKMGGEQALVYTVKETGHQIPFSWPRFEIDGQDSGVPAQFAETGRRQLTEGIEEITGEGVWENGAVLAMQLRVSPHSPLIRFRYLLSAEKSSEKDMVLTKTQGEALTYFSYPSEKNASRTEVRLSNYDHMIHAYRLLEVPGFETEDQVMGPILTEQRGEVCLLTAYEHGSHYPDKFVAYERTDSGIQLKALRGNYWNGQSIREKAYETIWLQAGAVKGNQDDIARAYREFQLKYCTLNAESRKPYIFYNTWAFQERNKFYNKSTYLASMNQERIEQEIDIAHEMGIDVFVLDTGWYQKTGDWEVNLAKFPDGLKSIREKLEGYGMKMGLWFNPTVAARTSKLLTRYAHCMSSLNGKEPQPFPIWETEESYSLCLVSEYWEAFADYLIYLADTIGVTYFKWDAVDQYCCDRTGHFHGGPGCTREEARDSYAFQLGGYMSKIIDRVCKAHPEVIVDFDVTEGGRCFGLEFLSSGKYFAINNGPYFHNFDITIPEDVWSNIFVNPGPARGWYCRQILSYDKWIPSVLFMTHYLPDDPDSSQQLNIASLILGQNGIWGDLLGISKEGVEKFHTILSAYKRVRDDITESYPHTLGAPGSTFEVHEKINTNGRGAAVLFGITQGTCEYRLQTAAKTDNITIFGNAEVIEKDNEVKIVAHFKGAEAIIVFFE